MRRRLLVAAVIVVAFLAGGGVAWGWQARTVAATGASRDRVATAITAGQDDDRSVADLVGRSANRAGQALFEDSLAELSRAIAPAQQVLDASAGKVADETVRLQLAAAIAQARVGLASSAAPARADELTSELSAASAAVAAAREAWEADQAAKAKARATPSPADSCRTTYHGPPFYTSVPGPTGTGANGDIPASEMAPVSWATDSRGDGYWFVTAATASLEKLDVAFRAAFGHDLDIDLAYRDLATQKAMYAALGPNVAATPGTSNHGWGTAFDVPEWPCQYGLHTPERDWLVAHGPAYGWHPYPYEYWHFDYAP